VECQLLDAFAVARPALSKALIRLSRTTKLLPKCLVLSDLEKEGNQVAAGGYGDIWKGRVCGQIVSVKMMRLFQDQDIQDALKVCFFFPAQPSSPHIFRRSVARLSFGANYLIRTCCPFSVCTTWRTDSVSCRHGWRMAMFSNSSKMHPPILIVCLW
jgi:hypothetical protein